MTSYRPLVDHATARLHFLTRTGLCLAFGLVLLIGGIVAAAEAMWGLTAVALAVAVAAVGAGIVVDSLARRLG